MKNARAGDGGGANHVTAKSGIGVPPAAGARKMPAGSRITARHRATKARALAPARGLLVCSCAILSVCLYFEVPACSAFKIIFTCWVRLEYPMGTLF